MNAVLSFFLPPVVSLRSSCLIKTSGILLYLKRLPYLVFVNKSDRLVNAVYSSFLYSFVSVCSSCLIKTSGILLYLKLLIYLVFVNKRDGLVNAVYSSSLCQSLLSLADLS